MEEETQPLTASPPKTGIVLESGVPETSISPPVLLAFSSKVPPELDVPLSAVNATTSSATTEPPVIMTSSPVARSLIAVSYTHLTLPTNREV